MNKETFMMIDFETLSLKNPAIFEIGVVVFDKDGIIKSLKINVDVRSCQEIGLEVDVSTIVWWLKTNKDLFSEKMLCEAVPIRKAIVKLFDTYKEFACTKVVGNGALADLLWVHQIIDKLNDVGCKGKEGILKTPWTFRDEMCFRTLKALLPTVNIEFEGTNHDALDDAMWQSLYMIEVLNNTKNV